MMLLFNFWCLHYALVFDGSLASRFIEKDDNWNTADGSPETLVCLESK